MRGSCIAALSIVLATLLGSCGGGELTLMEDVDICCWCEPVDIAFECRDADAIYNLDVILHVNDNYADESCRMVITATTPDSLTTTEVVTLATPVVHRAPVSRATDIVIPYRSHVVMPCQGIYHYTLRPELPLSGVESAGIIFKPQNR